MSHTGIATLVALAVGLTCVSVPAGAQDIRRLVDRSLTRERYEQEVRTLLEIEGQKLEMVFKRDTVPGSVFLTSTGTNGTSTYRYVGHDGQTLKLRLRRGESVDTVLTYFSTTGRFVVVPEELQHTTWRFELTPLPEQGIVTATLLDNGRPR
jgi:hypothetical protein